MKIYYIYHSCFIVETKSAYLIFDYYKSKDNCGDFDFKTLLSQILSSGKKVFIFASHSHSDHYNSKILCWNRHDLYYILSDDIRVDNYVKNMFFVNKDQELDIDIMNIKTFGSTDCGVSFLVSIDNLNFFHAGDLNWWKWNDDTEDEAKEMENSFKSIMQDIKMANSSIHAAFFPVDYRLEENYLCGGEYFIAMLHPEIFIPMHFDDNCKITEEFKKSQTGKNTGTNIIEINNSNQLLINEK